MRFVWIGLGGGVGALLRYLVGLAFSSSDFPWATLLVNLAGSFALGFLLAWGLVRLPVAVTTPIAVGVLGGFTTFSTFAWEGISMAGNGRGAEAAGYVAVSVVGGLLAAILGRLAGEVLV